MEDFPGCIPVSQIPGIVALAKPTPEGVAERQCVDIIYFQPEAARRKRILVSLSFIAFSIAFGQDSWRDSLGPIPATVTDRSADATIRRYYRLGGVGKM